MRQIAIIDKKIAKDLIIKNHYTHKWSSCRYAFGLFDDNQLIGAAIYGYPVGRQVVKSICSDLSNSDVLELTRLWIDDIAPRNTESWFLGQTFKWMRLNTTVRVLIAYSDPMYSHIGYVYQATNWLYQGNNTMLIKGYLHKIQGEVMHPRSVVAKYGTTEKEFLKAVDPDYERISMKKKHRYIYILRKLERKSLIAQLKHPVLAYPKDNANADW